MLRRSIVPSYFWQRIIFNELFLFKIIWSIFVFIELIFSSYRNNVYFLISDNKSSNRTLFSTASLLINFYRFFFPLTQGLLVLKGDALPTQPAVNDRNISQDCCNRRGMLWKTRWTGWAKDKSCVNRSVDA